MADQGHSSDLLWSSEVKLELLGPVRLGNLSGDDLTPRARKTRALLALVAMARGPVPRSKIVDMLWGERGDEQAKASLRQALYELRGLAAAGYISARRDAVALGPKQLPTDLGLLQTAIAAGDAASVAEFLGCIDRPLLATLDGITPELDDWLRDERERLTTALIGGSAAVAEAAIDKDPAVSRSIADQLERIDPLDERVAQLGIRADLAARDRTSASRRHGRFKTRLHEQLGVEPSEETGALLRNNSRAAADTPTLESPLLARPPAVRRARTIVLAGLAVALLLAAGVSYFLFRAAVPTTPTVAVLPFDDFGQKNDDYFASGVSDEILNLLAHQNRIKVLGRVSAAQLTKQAGSLNTARKLGIGYLLDGSVRTSDGRVLVIARLTRVADGAQVWSERYERGVGDIFAVQGEIAGAVAKRLAQSFGGVRPQETSPQVYDAYLAARQLARQRRDATLKEAERLLKDAVAQDPNYAPALAELAQVIMLRADHPTSYGPLPLQQARSEAERYARRALRLDPNLGEAYAALGFLSLSDQRSVPFYRKAVELDPQRPEFHRWLASSLLEMKLVDQAVAEFKRAVAIDPLWGLNYEHLCGTLRHLGRDAEAERYEQQFIRLTSDDAAKLQFVAFMANARNQPSQELIFQRKIYERYPDERQARFKLATTLGLLGEHREAAKLMQGDTLAHAALTGDWKALGVVARQRGLAYWDNDPGFWNLDELLIESGQSRVIVDLYDAARPIVARGHLNPDKLTSITTALALFQVGRAEEGRKLWARGQDLDARLPSVGLFREEREFGQAITRAFRGDTAPLIAVLDRRSRTRPADVAQVPAMSLRYSPLYRPIVNDPRFERIDERVRAWINYHRVKVGLAPITREQWISDPRTLLTKN